MDKAAQLYMTSNFEVFKEPRGFIKILEFILAIFAFATTTSLSSYSEFTVQCTEGADLHTQRLPFSYPFKLKDTTQFEQPFCNDTAPKVPASACCNFNSPAEFYVFIGVMAFLYSLAAIVLYVVFDDTYRRNDNIPTADFVVSAVFTVLWFISSCAWAQGVTDLKYYTNPEELFIDIVPECAGEHPDCAATYYGNFASLNVSLIFGFLNTFVWGGNLWFLFKETKWHQEQPTPDPMTPGSGASGAGLTPQQEQQHI